MATPESQGLDSSALDKAAVEITEAYEALGYTRDCFLVVKNGLIVSEKILQRVEQQHYQTRR